MALSKATAGPSGASADSSVKTYIPEKILSGQQVESNQASSLIQEPLAVGDRPYRLPSVSVVIPVHNGGEGFRRCLQALSRSIAQAKSTGAKPTQQNSLGSPSSADAGAQMAQDAVDIEVIVVADGDSDGSWKLAESFGARLIRLPESKGPARARNTGANAAKGDILFFIDADVEVHAATLHQVMESFAKAPNLAALIGSYDDAPGEPNFLSQYRNLLHHYTHQTASLNASTFWGACGAIRRCVFQQVGGFDSGYRRPCIEDIELGYRVRQAGHKIHLRKDIQVKHLKHWSAFSLLRADFFYRALPWTALLLQLKRVNPQQYRTVSRELNISRRSRLSVVLVYGLVAAVAIAPWYGQSWAMAAIAGLALLLLNLSVYAFFYQSRGLIFALQTVPWHWLYFAYSGLAYAIGHLRYLWKSAARWLLAGTSRLLPR